MSEVFDTEDRSYYPYFSQQTIAKFLYNAFLSIESQVGPLISPPWEELEDPKFYTYLVERFWSEPSADVRKFHGWAIEFGILYNNVYHKKRSKGRHSPYMIEWELLKPTDKLKMILGLATIKVLYGNNGPRPTGKSDPKI
jgi:hypothetical protein